MSGNLMKNKEIILREGLVNGETVTHEFVTYHNGESNGTKTIEMTQDELLGAISNELHLSITALFENYGTEVENGR